MQELDLKEELANMRVFDRLNNEKITPFFMSMAKSAQKTDDLSVICDDSGTAFTEDKDRHKHITDTFEKLYKNPEPEKNIQVEDINEFLSGALETDEVKNAKLSELEKNRLEKELHITELDTAITQANLKSAPGLDGLNNFFIKSFWNYLRVPLFKYANVCIANGRLTENFRTAKIRLIPKKGNSKYIGNWRPISLLGCFYKLLSRVYTNRLKRVIDKITAVGQKGYSEKKYCQEVLIMLIEGIKKCEKNKIKGAIISLDMKKAFDSISHSYLESVLKFFNFGPNFIKAIKVLCTNRQAAVILESDLMGKTFKLERGNAQGDTISPFLFNICYQVLLLRLNTELQIDSVLDLPEVPNSHRPLPATVSKKPRRAIAFADDCTAITVLNKRNLDMIKNILNDFSSLSGLECNIDKSHLLPIGDTDNIPHDIFDSGFEIKDKITVLGLTFSGKGEIFKDQEEIIVKKIRNKVSHWS
jgi:hypothetical protein